MPIMFWTLGSLPFGHGAHGALNSSSASSLWPVHGSGLGQIRRLPGRSAALHRFNEVDIDLPSGWRPVLKCPRFVPFE